MTVLINCAIDYIKSKGDENIRKFKDDDNGVAAVIGTIMGLMVFLAFISLFVLYWVPVMMEDNEAQHMRTVIDQFGDLKATVDDLIVKDDKENEPYSPVKLGADGVPMFEKESPSELSLRLASEFTNMTFQDSGEDIYENCSGSIDIVAYNRFYVKQNIIYENGAILIDQKKGDVVKVEPNFNVERQGSNVKLTTTMISLIHDTDDSIAGIQMEGVTSHLLYNDKWTYTDITGPSSRVTLNIKTRYTGAWSEFYGTVLTNEGLISGQDYNVTSSSDTVEVIIDRVSEITLSHAYVEAYIGRETT